MLQFINKIKILPKTAFAFSLIMILIIGGLGFNIVNIKKIRRLNSHMLEIVQIVTLEKQNQEVIKAVSEESTGKRVSEIKKNHLKIINKSLDFYLSINNKDDLKEFEKIIWNLRKTFDKGLKLVDASIMQKDLLIARLEQDFNKQKLDTNKKLDQLLAFNKKQVVDKSLYIEWLNYLILFISLSIAVIAFFVTKFFIVDQLKNILSTIKLITAGDYTQRIETKLEDEIGMVSDSINDMADDASNTIFHMKMSFNEVLLSTEELINSVDETSKAFHSMLESIRVIHETSDSQNESVASSERTIKKMNGYLGIVSTNIKEQTTLADDTNSSIRNVEDTVIKVKDIAQEADDLSQGLSTAAGEGEKAVHEMISAIEEIEQSSNEIADIVTIIDGIAEQTNLLAMNAAIEAAHAGDSGKGFAVVADEIRKLAENSGVQAKSISSLIKDIVSKITNTVTIAKTAEGGLKRITSDVQGSTDINLRLNNMMKLQAEQANNIVKVIERLVNITHEVKENTNNLKGGGKDITNSMDNVKELSSQIKLISLEQLEESKKVRVALDNVDNMVKNNNLVMNELNQRLDHFKIDNAQDRIMSDVKNIAV